MRATTPARRRLPRIVAVAVVALVAALVALVPNGGAANRIPPAPAGSTVITAGHVPSVCTGTFDAYASNFGVYFSRTAKQWLSAPRCVPRWGYLEELKSGITRAGGTYTFTAVPTDGSNSGQYAPEAKAISWSPPGKVVSGCGAADLTCTVIPVAKATAEWQWFEARVSMPRHFFIDSPGSNCAGQHLCAGVTTQAWGWVGVPPQGVAIIRGTVTKDPSCAGSGTCSTARPGVAGVTVTLRSPQRTYTARTRGDGTYKVEVKPGTYTVTPAKARTYFGPTRRTVRATSVNDRVDFTACGPSTAERSRAGRALADGTYKLPGASLGGNAFVNDDTAPGCLTHGVEGTASGSGSSISVTLKAQLGCRQHNIANTALYKFVRTETFTFDGIAQGSSKRLKVGDLILEAYVPTDAEIAAQNGTNFIALTYMEARVDSFGSGRNCFAGWNRPADGSKGSTPVLILQQ